MKTLGHIPYLYQGMKTIVIHCADGKLALYNDGKTERMLKSELFEGKMIQNDHNLLDELGVRNRSYQNTTIFNHYEYTHKLRRKYMAEIIEYLNLDQTKAEVWEIRNKIDTEL